MLNHATHVFEKWIGSGAFRSVTVVTSTNDESALSGFFETLMNKLLKTPMPNLVHEAFWKRYPDECYALGPGKVREEVDTILEEAQGKLISLLGARNIELLEKKYDV